MSNEQLNKVADQIGVAQDALQARMNTVLSEQGSSWSASGKSSEECSTMALRVAARQLVSERAKIERSGCINFEGMFVKVPPYKDWGRAAYNKMKNTLATLDGDAREALVAQGSVVIYENNHDGTYTRTYNPSLMSKQAFEEDHATDTVNELPSRVFELDDNTHFYVVWDKANPTFPSGDSNWKYGSPRPLEELDRKCLFLGRKAGSKDAIDLFTVSLSGQEAKTQPQAFRPGSIGVRPGKNNNLYSKAGVTSFLANDALASMFDSPPLVIGDSGPEGIVPELVTDFLPGLHALPDWYNANKDSATKWTDWVGLVGEVIHIDPRERGGYTITVGDLDITSTAPAVEMAVPEGTTLDFAVGSQIMLVGSPWQTREGDTRFSNYGWWIVDAIAPSVQSDDGWDAE